MEWHKIRIPTMDIRGRETRTKCAHRGVMHTAKFLKFEFLFEKKKYEGQQSCDTLPLCR